MCYNNSMNNIVNIHTDDFKKYVELQKASVWAIKKLMPRQNNLRINIRLKKMKDWGGCEPLYLERSPKEFHIEIRSTLSLRSSVRVLFHELVHVQQYASNKLRYVNSKSMWLKENHTDTPYADQPWEVEALMLEIILFNIYFDK